MYKILLVLFSAALLFSCGGTESNDCKPTPDVIITAKHMKDDAGRSTLQGSLFNQSLNQDFTDPKIRVDFFSAAGENIGGAQEFTIEKNLKRGEAVPFEFDYMAPVGADSAVWKVSCVRDL